MKLSRLRILHLEDNAQDAELVRARLNESGQEFEFQRVDTQESFRKALKEGGYDLILADRSAPCFDGLAALRMAHKEQPDVPFVFVSGTLDEDVAIETLTNGATDYVLKHKMSRLIPAVKRALEEAASRREKQKLEQELLQAQKMESLGTLAGGIAHDFNNVLGIISGYACLLDESSLKREEVSEISATIRQAAQRGAGLVRQLLTFARKSDADLSEVDLNMMAQDLIGMLERTFPKTIVIEKRFDPSVPVLVADPTQIHQALLNLCLNARDAMPDGGRLKVETGIMPGIALRARHPLADEESYIYLKVSDSGCGMSEEIRKRIFDPFFTTKEQGKGTGLGLAVVYGVIQSHHGFVEVESAPGQGAAFRLFFPRGAKEKEVPGDEEPTVASISGGFETLLIVEDEAVLRGLMVTLLQTKGYRTIEAGDGEEGLRLFREHRDEIGLVLTDHGLPKLDGSRMFEEIKKEAPDVRLILCSGFIEPSMRSKLFAAGVKDIILKPYENVEILRKIRDVLDSFPVH